MLGLYTLQTATLQVIEAEAPRETSTERLRAAIDRKSLSPDRAWLATGKNSQLCLSATGDQHW